MQQRAQGYDTGASHHCVSPHENERGSRGEEQRGESTEESFQHAKTEPQNDHQTRTRPETPKNLFRPRKQAEPQHAQVSLEDTDQGGVSTPRPDSTD